MQGLQVWQGRQETPHAFVQDVGVDAFLLFGRAYESATETDGRQSPVAARRGVGCNEAHGGKQERC